MNENVQTACAVAIYSPVWNAVTRIFYCFVVVIVVIQFLISFEVIDSAWLIPSERESTFIQNLAVSQNSKRKNS